jgi:hypothetical protein
MFIVRIIAKHTNTLNYLLRYSTGQSSSWEANWLSASQEIPGILWNLKVHYHIHNWPPPLPNLSISIQFMPLSHLLIHCVEKKKGIA